jgi:peptidoglycan/xylan/chitin deacetylase (PgdA/CDA1 family)
LCYHAISPSWSSDLAVTPEDFERQVSTLAREGWRSATFTEVVRQDPVDRTMVITFDDAFASVKRYAQPVLASLGITGTVFVPTDCVSRQTPLAWAGLDRPAGTSDADELLPMGWDDLAELAELGWEIGSHTQTHRLLTSLADDALAEELQRSRAECRARIGGPVTSLAYPYGGVDDRVVVHAQRAGYEGAAALEWPAMQLNRYRYPRVGIYRRDSWPRFRLKTAGWSRSSYGAKLLAWRKTHAVRV